LGEYQAETDTKLKVKEIVFHFISRKNVFNYEK